MFVGNGSEFVRPEKKVFGSRALYGDDFHAAFAERFGDGVNRSGSDAAGDHDNRAEVGIDFTCLSERANHGVQALTDFQRNNLAGRNADSHDNHGNRAFFAVEIGNRQRDSFAVFIRHNNEKLPGFGFERQTRVLDDHFPNIGRQQGFADNLKHCFEVG